MSISSISNPFKDFILNRYRTPEILDIVRNTAKDEYALFMNTCNHPYNDSDPKPVAYVIGEHPTMQSTASAHWSMDDLVTHARYGSEEWRNILLLEMPNVYEMLARVANSHDTIEKQQGGAS